MICPTCLTRQHVVTNTRISVDGREIVRLRKCLNGHTWHTRELPAARLHSPLPRTLRQRPTSQV